jgi:hypothetical protein
LCARIVWKRFHRRMQRRHGTVQPRPRQKPYKFARRGKVTIERGLPRQKRSPVNLGPSQFYAAAHAASRAVDLFPWPVWSRFVPRQPNGASRPGEAHQTSLCCRYVDARSVKNDQKRSTLHQYFSETDRRSGTNAAEGTASCNSQSSRRGIVPSFPPW